LVDATLVILHPDGRNTVVELNMHSLDIGKKFITKLEMYWEKRLENLKSFIEKR